jgi:hypothetical protein
MLQLSLTTREATIHSTTFLATTEANFYGLHQSFPTEREAIFYAKLLVRIREATVHGKLFLTIRKATFDGSTLRGNKRECEET